MRIGRHMPTHSKMVRAAEIARQIGCQSIQIFVSNPTAWQPPAYDPVGDANFAQALRTYELEPAVIHAPYLINLGTLDGVIWEKSIALLSWTLQRGVLLGVKYIVFHTGSHRGAGLEAGLARVAEGIAQVLAVSPPEAILLLENDVGAKNTLGGRFEQLATILKQLPQYEERLGVCLDTAHLWGAGYDISSAETTLAVLRNFDETVGLERLKVIHLNDTKMALGSRRDVHARLREGLIGEEGLRVLLNDPRLDHVTVILETPILTDEHEKEIWEHDARHLSHVRALIERRSY